LSDWLLGLDAVPADIVGFFFKEAVFKIVFTVVFGDRIKIRLWGQEKIKTYKVRNEHQRRRHRS
jgi:hypothetical protein